MTHRDKTVASTAAIAVTICFALAAGLIANVQSVYAQDNSIVDNFTDAVVPDNTPPEQQQTDTELVLGEINTTIAAISALVASAMGIVTYLVAAIRSKTGDRIISDQSTEWLQDLYEKQKTLDGSVRDIFRQVMERSNEIEILTDVAKRNSPEFAKAYDENLPKLVEKNKAVQQRIQHWTEEAEKIKFAVSPTSDPIGK